MTEPTPTQKEPIIRPGLRDGEFVMIENGRPVPVKKVGDRWVRINVAPPARLVKEQTMFIRTPGGNTKQAHGRAVGTSRAGKAAPFEKHQTTSERKKQPPRPRHH